MAQVRTTLDGNTLSWVKSEIDQTMTQARQALEAYVENPEDDSQLRFCLNYLHQVYGTLQMVELYGAAMLAEEMEKVTHALLEGKVKSKDDAYETIMKGMLSLPDYLEKLQSGHQDYPIVLLPLLNDLRAARGETLLTESAVFSPDLEVEAPVPMETAEQPIDTLARKLRHAYHLGLLNWYRNHDEQTGLKKIGGVIEKLRNASNEPDASRILWAASGVIEALLDKGIEGSVAVKLLMGQVDRQMKKIIDEGEFALASEPPRDLLKNLLYYVATSNSKGTRVRELKDAFALAQVMPDAETLERARADLSGPNADLMRTVSGVMLEDLVQVKDTLDVFVRAEDKDLSVLGDLATRLQQMSDTLGMLGFGQQRQHLQEQVAILNDMAEGKREVDDAVLMDIAGALIGIEDTLTEPAPPVENVPAYVEEATQEIHLPSDESLQVRFRNQEQRKLIKQVVEQVKLDLEKIKESFNDYVRTPKRVEVINDVPALLDGIRGSLSMLSLTRAADLIQASSQYIQRDILDTGSRPDVAALDALADAISSVEYYLESLTESWGHPTAILDVAEQSLATLGIDLGEEQPREPAEAIQAAPQPVDDDQTLIDMPAAELEALGPDRNQDDEDTMELSIEGGALDDLDEEPDGELTLEGFDDEASLQMEGINFDQAAPEEAAVQAPETEGSISQEFDLPSVEETPQPEAPAQREVASNEAAASGMDDLDDEIIDIFLEEAEEEHGNISRMLPAWQADPNDEETLKQLRRSFHTLKGSGRLVGAADVGEFAWAYENMLNRVIDKTISASPEMFALLERGRDKLPDLFEMFKTGKKPGQDVFGLMAEAEALSKGEPLPKPPATSAEPEAADTEETVAEAAPEPEPGAGEAIESEEIDLSAEGLSIDFGDDDGEAASAAAERQEHWDSQGDANISGARALPIEEGGMDPVLLDIYRKEIDNHLQALHDYLRKWQDGYDRSANNELMRALHTLKGSSRTARVQPVAELCNILEDYTRYLQEGGVEVSEDMAMLLADTGEFISETVTQLNEPGATPPDNTDLIKRARDLYETTRTQTPTMQIDLDAAQEPAAAEQPEISETIDLTPSEEIELSALAEDDEQGTPVAADYDEELLEIFLEEGEEILNESDHTLHDWTSEPDNIDHVKALQRQLHTLKGGARMAGVTEIGDLSHSIETMLTAIVDGELDVDDAMFGALQKAQDRLVQMLEVVRKQQVPPSAPKLIAAINALSRGETPPSMSGEYSSSSLQMPNEPSSMQIPMPEEAAQQETHAATEAEETLPGPTLEEDEERTASPGDEDVQVLEAPANDPPADEAMASAQAEPLEEPTGDDESAAVEPPAKAQDDEAATNVVPFESAPAQEIEPSAPSEPEPQQAPSRAPTREQVRVRADLLDNLVNFAGEVSIYRSRLEQQTNAFRYNLVELDDTISRLREQLRKFEIEAETQIQYRLEESGQTHEDFDPLEFDRFTQMQTLSRGMMESLNDLDSLRSILSNLTRENETLLLQQSRVNTDLQEGLMRTRMVPFSGQIPRLRRIVRQTAEELGKKVELHLHGSESEIDRTVLERIMSPLEHMLRNAVAHGIETPEQRQAANKSESGNIHLGFAREGSDIVISVSDDGAGINLEAIQRKAVERGILRADKPVSKEALLDIIMESGFSTADQVSQIAGRGVGMDVVSNEIKQLGGLLKIDTEQSKGTTFTINMPLSLSVTRALMVEVGEENYAIPLLGVESVERATRDELQRLQSEKGATYNWLENEYQYIHLGSMMGLTEMQKPSEDQKRVPLLLVRSGEYRAAIHVDGLIGSREVVVKPVGPQLSTLRGISGATIMGDGGVVLILDLGVIMRLASAEHETAFVEPLIGETELEEKAIPTIMVVDDSITVRKVTTRLLERNHFKTLSAKDGVDALSQLQEHKPDCMLLDVEMPRMDGFELATNMRNDAELKNIPIIMITSRTGQKHRDRAMEIGVNIYMGKPYSEGELLDNIQSLIQAKD